MPLRAEPARRRVLVVEDEPMIRELIVTRLELGGYQTFVASDGFQGLAALAEVRPAGLILDINMPRLDGFGVLKKMRETGITTPTMVLTARNQPDDVRTAIALGARDFLAKPFRDEQLLSRVARLLRKAADPRGRTEAAGSSAHSSIELNSDAKKAARSDRLRRF